MAATRDAYGDKLVELGKTNKNIVVLDADLSGSTRTAKFAKVYPDRFFNMGIAEANMMGVAAGLAISGKTVFVSTFAMFATLRPYEQIRNSIASQNLNVKIVASHAGISVGEDGLSHQTIEDIAILRAIPNMKVFVPADAVSAAKMVEEAVNIHGPVYIRMSRSKTPIIYDPETYTSEKGQANILKDANEARVAFLATGNMVFEAQKVADRLEKEGYTTIVADFSSVKPINKQMLVSIARRSRLVVTLEEHTILGGFGSAVCEVLSDEYPSRVMRIGINDIFGESGSPAALFQQFGLSAEEIYRKVLKKIHAI
ncbi:MAG: transketolase family protein [Phycisphaerae bacterium]|nr:transketolase family protein [Phycisphaerae bacterium]